MTGRVEHDPQARGVAVGWLVGGLGPAALDHERHRCLYVVHEDLEVRHLRLAPGPLRPHRWLVPLLGLEVEADAAAGIAELHPAGSRSRRAARADLRHLGMPEGGSAVALYP